MTVNVTERQFAFEFSYPADRNSGRLAEPLPPQGPAGRVQDPLAGRDPQLLRPGVLAEARRRAGDHHDAARHADPARHLSGRVHRAVRRRPLADARLGPRADAHGIPGLAASQQPNGAPPSVRPPRRPPNPACPAAVRLQAPPAALPPAEVQQHDGGAVRLGHQPRRGQGGLHRLSRLRPCHTLAAAGTTGTVGPNLGTAVVRRCQEAGDCR